MVAELGVIYLDKSIVGFGPAGLGQMDLCLDKTGSAYI